MINISLTNTEFRRLLDLVYSGNWLLNSMRDADDRIVEYDKMESKIFGYCRANGFKRLFEDIDGVPHPSQEYEEGGILDAIFEYEEFVLYDGLAEELARRDMGHDAENHDEFEELTRRIEEYADEFEENGLENVTVNTIS